MPPAHSGVRRLYCSPDFSIQRPLIQPRLSRRSASHSFSPVCTKAGLLRLAVLRWPIVTFADLFAGGKAASPEFSD